MSAKVTGARITLLGGQPADEKKDGWRRTTKAAVAFIILFGAAYGAHHYGLVDLSKPAGYASNSLSHGMDYAKDAYNFTASYILPSMVDSAKMGLKYGVIIGSTLSTVVCVIRVVSWIVVPMGGKIEITMPYINLWEGTISFGSIEW